MKEILLEEGLDLGDLLGVCKYEPPEYTGNVSGKSGRTRSTLPMVLRKTDETRLEAIPRILDELRGHPYYITTKCDGTSFSAVWIPSEDPEKNGLHVCSRTRDLKDDNENDYWAMARKYNLEEILKDSPWAIQGEMVGPGWQGNKMGLPELELRIFNLWNWQTQTWGTLKELSNFCIDNNLTMVPLVEADSYFNYTAEDLIRKAEGTYIGTSNPQEGIVVRSQGLLKSEVTHSSRVSFKVINRDFLLKGK